MAGGTAVFAEGEGEDAAATAEPVGFADAGRAKGGEVLEPKAGGLALGMAELPGVDDLVGAAEVGAEDANGILKGNVGNGGGPEEGDEVESLLLEMGFGLEPTGAGGGEVGARWEGDEEIPVGGEVVEDGVLDVGAEIVGGEEVTADGLVTETEEGIADPAGELTGH
jgi:hypothetical protein